MLSSLNLTDMETCYKMVKGPLMNSLVLTSDRFGFEPEATARLAKARVRVWEIPISYSGRRYAEGKKVGPRDGIAATWHVIRFNLLGRPPLRPVVATTSPEQADGSLASGESVSTLFPS